MKKLSPILFAILLCALAAVAVVPGQAQTEPLEKSIELRKEKKYAEAAAEIGKAIALEPENAELYLRRAHLYYLAQNRKGVSEDVGKAVELDPFNKQNIIRGSRMLMDMGQCEQVLNIVNAYILKDSKGDDAFDMRAQAKTCLGDLQGAFDDMSAAIELNPKHSLHRTNQANILSRMGDGKKSIELLTQEIKSLEAELAKANPDAAIRQQQQQKASKIQLSMIYLTRSRAYFKNKESAQAIADLTRAFELHPAPDYIRFRARVYRIERKFNLAIADYTEAIRIAKNDVSLIYLERGETFMEAEKYDEALQDYEQALKLEPELKDIVEKKIAAAKEKLEASEKQPK